MKNKGTWIIVGIVAAFVLLIAGIFVTTNNKSHFVRGTGSYGRLRCADAGET